MNILHGVQLEILAWGLRFLSEKLMTINYCTCTMSSDINVRTLIIKKFLHPHHQKSLNRSGQIADLAKLEVQLGVTWGVGASPQAPQVAPLILHTDNINLY